jgi:N6-L-threonylcarbamoyladenine synthase
VASFGFRDSNFEFPAIALLVSGGHTQLVLIKDIGKYKILGETRDDAAGECFDKVAKLLNLGYPGGPAVAAQATKYKKQDTKYKLPRPMINHKNYDFSFSGLKTAVLYLLRDMKDVNIPVLCKETQQAIIDVLIDKTIRAAKEYKVKTVILSGGVAANDELRKQLKSKIQTTNYKLLKFLVPTKNLCTDNAAMIAVAGYYNKPTNWRKLKADANLRIGQKMR